MSELLSVRNLNKRYSNFSLEDVSFSIPAGSIMGFIGENGAGKTTTLKLILNELHRDSGTVEIFGLDSEKDERKIKEQIGVVFDECCFPGGFLAADVEKVLRPVFHSWDGALYRRYLSDFSLPKDKKIRDYSRGMKMKLSIAAALAHRPRLLILDEATSGLDPVMRSDILDVFLDFIQDENRAVLFSSHITSDLERVADYVTFIQRGKIVLSRQKDELLEEYGVLKCGASEFSKIDRADYLRCRRGACECEALVTDRRAAKRKYPNFVVDTTSLDEIMLMYGKGEKA